MCRRLKYFSPVYDREKAGRDKTDGETPSGEPDNDKFVK